MQIFNHKSSSSSSLTWDKLCLFSLIIWHCHLCLCCLNICNVLLLIRFDCLLGCCKFDLCWRFCICMCLLHTGSWQANGQRVLFLSGRLRTWSSFPSLDKLTESIDIWIILTSFRCGICCIKISVSCGARGFWLLQDGYFGVLFAHFLLCLPAEKRLALLIRRLLLFKRDLGAHLFRATSRAWTLLFRRSGASHWFTDLGDGR